jgi:hypothetical protein
MSIDISDVARRIQYSGSAGTGPYQFTFEVLAQTDIKVYVDETLQVLTTDYTVTINGDGTGSVTLVSAASVANTITIIGDRAITRTTDFVTGGDLLADSLNDELDSIVIYCQQLEEKFARCFSAPEYDTATTLDMPDVADRASKYLAFDASGNPVATSGTTSPFPVSTYMETVLDDANAAAARTTLGVAISSDVQAYDADTLKADTADVLTAGFAATPYNAGTKTTGTFTPDEANGNMQYAVNGGAHTLAPPTNNCTLVIQYTNNASAGAITTSGFTKVSGAFTTTNADDFMCYITKLNGFSVLDIRPLQ